ncbi:MAG TPA: leucine-rich repeat protein, partial [Luteolibacter sp.]
MIMNRSALHALSVALAPFLGFTSPLAADTLGNFKFTDHGSTITIDGYISTKLPGEQVEIPATINGKPVTVIGGSAFRVRRTVASVTIPSSVTTIEEEAFAASGLETVIIPAGV